MKTIKKLLILVFCMSLCVSCLKDEVFEEPPVVLKKALIKVQPSSSGDVLVKAQEDWQNINDALQNAKSGQTVQLAEGLFYLHKSIVCWDFNGTLKGSGMDKTTIQTAPGMPFDVSDCPLHEWSWQTLEGHSIIYFPHNKNTEERTVVVSDLTIIGNEPATEWHNDPINDPTSTKNSLCAITVFYKNLLGISGYWGDQSLSDKINLNVQYKNISVIGEEDPNKYSHGFSFKIGLAAFGASSGNFEAINIYMANVDYGLCPHVFCGENSTVSIKNFKVENATVGIYSFTSTGWNIINNEFKKCSNQAVNLTTANHVYDLPNGSSIIKDNLFIMETLWNGIYGLRMQNVQVKDNIFKGESYSGILARLGDYWEIKDNDLCDLTVDHPDGLTIRLDRTYNSVVKDNANQVVGGSLSDPSNYIGEGMECDD